MMDYANEWWVRLYVRDTADWLNLSFEAQGLFVLLLRKVDRSGVVELGKGGARSIARIVGHPHRVEVITAAFEELLADGCIELSDDGRHAVIPNFVAAQNTPDSPAKRSKAYRERRRDEVLATCASRDESSRNVTERDEARSPRDESSRNVTPPSRNVTEPSRAVTQRHAPSLNSRREREDNYPPTPRSGGPGRDGTGDQPSEQERRADIEAVASVGRTIDPSLDRDEVEQRRATELDPSEHEPVARSEGPSLAAKLVDVLNEHSGGRIVLVLDSAQLRALRGKLAEVSASREIGDEELATLAVWAARSNGLSWAKEPVGPAWLLKGSNLASALSNALGWWDLKGHRDSATARAHRAALRSLGAEVEEPARPEPRPAPPPAAPPPAILTLEQRQKLLIERGRIPRTPPPSRTEGPSGGEPGADATLGPATVPAAVPRAPVAPVDLEARRAFLLKQVAEETAKEQAHAPAARVSPSQPPPTALASGDDRGAR